MRAMALAMLMATGADATELISPATLQAQVEAFAGVPAIVDPRLLLPACRRAEMAFAAGGDSVVVRCAAPEWRVFIPVGRVVSGVAAPVREAPATRAPAIRRGDRVTVEIAGAGFSVTMEAVAEGDSRDERVNLRPFGGGRRFIGQVGDDGRVRIPGLNAMVNGR